ncbi:uncharacterized protein ATNIH1004_000612 [Aspergillus tanneri]|uniref:Uncharacterized protein n=1 Tax=Aspergillus tanneri TaxID=1220188 RepID=A0A5M9N0E0_9EURO|nr:uncharacterized protein ATNIH1004_000612 [Aspergillus tanneri]KAA8651716.1 hypothetical protein ATNIH1004_000612 [Aspergillus tanneri]
MTPMLTTRKYHDLADYGNSCTTADAGSSLAAGSLAGISSGALVSPSPALPPTTIPWS